MNRQLALVFPGQGSQSQGMLREIAATHPIVETLFAQAANILGFSLWQLVQAGPTEALNQTVNTQPAMLAAGVAMYRVWQEVGGAKPALMAGHSLGEYTALVCAEALDFEVAIDLVATRGRLMQEAVESGEGAMAAILGLSASDVNSLCEAAAEGEVLQAANLNSPQQIVISGAAKAVERAVEQAKARGAKRALLLPVSVPSHCALMKPAAEQFARELANVPIATPKIPVINNVDVTRLTHPDDLRDVLVRQLFSPVRWVETIESMQEMGVQQYVECGPGKVLSGLIKRIDRDSEQVCLQDEASLQAALHLIQVSEE